MDPRDRIRPPSGGYVTIADFALALEELRVRAAGRELLVSPATIAADLGLPVATVRGYFAGRELPSADQLEMILSLLGARPDEAEDFQAARRLVVSSEGSFEEWSQLAAKYKAGPKPLSRFDRAVDRVLWVDWRRIGLIVLFAALLVTTVLLLLSGLFWTPRFGLVVISLPVLAGLLAGLVASFLIRRHNRRALGIQLVGETLWFQALGDREFVHRRELR